MTLILPGAIDTPFWTHARPKTGKKLTAMGPVYQPEDVAASIALAATHPRRGIFVGGAAKLMDQIRRISPALLDRQMLLGDNAFAQQQADGPPDTRREESSRPVDEEGSIHGEYDEEAKSTSLYTRTFEWYPALKPLARALALGTVALGGARADPPDRRRRPPPPRPGCRRAGGPRRQGGEAAAELKDGRMRQLCGRLLLIAAFPGATPAGACPLCDSETGRRVREGIFSGADFGPNLAATALPFLVFLAIAASIRLVPSGRGPR